MAIFGLVIVVGLAVALLAPVHVDVELDTAAEPDAAVLVRARWLFLVWRNGKVRQARRARSPRPRKRTGSRGRGLRRMLAVLGTPGFLRRAGRLVVELLRVLVPRTADVRVRFGFEDPVSTGMLFGAVHATTGLAQGSVLKVRLEPEFSGPALDAQARFVWAVRPAAVLWPVGTFVASPMAWRATFAALRAK